MNPLIFGRLSRALAAVALCVSNYTYAGTQMLGFEIGVSTLEQVTSTLQKKTKVKDLGLNKYSLGAVLRTDGSSYDIEGLDSVFYVFDAQKKLVMVTMIISNSRFDDIYQALSNKYKVSTKQLPFVGDKLVRFDSPDSMIEMSAPHMSSETTITYVRHDLEKKISAQLEAEASAKKKSDAAKF